MEPEEHHNKSSLYEQPRFGQADFSNFDGATFRQTFTRPAPDEGKPGSARQYLEEQGVLRPQSGHKRKAMDEDGNRDHRQHGTNPYASALFKRSTFSTTPTPTPELRFKLPQPLQRQRQQTLHGRCRDSDEVEGSDAGDAAVKRRRTCDPFPSPRTARTIAPTPSPISVSSPSARFHLPSRRRDSLVGSDLNTPTFQTPRSLSFSTGLAVRKPGASAADEQASSPQSPPFRRIKKRPVNEIHEQQLPASSARQQINADRTRFTNPDGFNVPTVDRRLKEPPPDLESLNRLLHQVPGILKDLFKKQEELIRDLATKVNTYEERIGILETDNTNLREDMSAKSKSFTEELNAKFTAMEERMSSKENEIAALKSRNEHLQRQRYGTHENTEARETLILSPNHLTPESDQVKSTHSRNNSLPQEPISVFDQDYVYGYHQRETQEPPSAFDAFTELAEQKPRSSDENQHASQEHTDTFDGLDHQAIQDSLDALNELNHGSVFEEFEL